MVNGAKYALQNLGLEIKNVQLEDEGVYYCQATVPESGEMKRFEINVQVESEPKWITEPKDTEAVLGQDVVIKCEAQAKPLPIYTWLRNGIQVNGERFIITGGTLTVRNVAREDYGAYTCIAENNSGRVEATFKMLVLVVPEIAPMEPIRVIEGNKAILRCEVREAYPKARIRWKFAETNEFIQETDSVKVFSDTDNANELGELIGSWSELRFESVNRIDKRNYTCHAKNTAGESERTGPLIVEYIPKHLKSAEAKDFYYSWLITDSIGSSGNTGLQTTRGFPVILTCLADAEPRPAITWFFNNEPIKSDGFKYKLLKDEEGFAQLEVTPKSTADFNDYVCRATNRLGFDDKYIQLRQATSPRTAPLLRLIDTKPESVMFNLDVSGAPQADGGLPVLAYKINWRMNNADWNENNHKDISVDPEESIKDIENVEIDTLLPDTEYVFRVAALNRVGLGSWSAMEQRIRTSARRQPDPVKLITREECEASTRCWLEWKVESNGGSPIREFLVRWRRVNILSSKNYSYQL